MEMHRTPNQVSELKEPISEFSRALIDLVS